MRQSKRSDTKGKKRETNRKQEKMEQEKYRPLKRLRRLDMLVRGGEGHGNENGRETGSDEVKRKGTRA